MFDGGGVVDGGSCWLVAVEVVADGVTAEGAGFVEVACCGEPGFA